MQSCVRFFPLPSTAISRNFSSQCSPIVGERNSYLSVYRYLSMCAANSGLIALSALLASSCPCVVQPLSSAQVRELVQRGCSPLLHRRLKQLSLLRKMANRHRSSSRWTACWNSLSLYLSLSLFWSPWLLLLLHRLREYKSRLCVHVEVERKRGSCFFPEDGSSWA